MQRKLDTHEKYWIAAAADAVMSLMRGCECTHPWDKRFADLLAVDEHGTTDGKPYDEPQPEIGEGYRVATEADKQRQDREMHDVHGRWVPAHVGNYSCNYTYRVPQDRIPTDEDAKQRPMVMVRDQLDQAWSSIKLIAVRDGCNPFVGLCPTGLLSSWVYCRFPYPGELP